MEKIRRSKMEEVRTGPAAGSREIAHVRDVDVAWIPPASPTGTDAC